MRKIIFLITLTCLTAVFISGCSLPDQFSRIKSSVSDYSREKLNSNDNNTDIGEKNSSGGSKVSNKDVTEKSEETGNVPLSESETDSQTESEDSFSSEDDQTEESLDMQTTEGYVLSSDGYTMYVDLENTGSRLYSGEGENRKVAFGISDAEQIQTNVSEFNPARANLIRSGIKVTIEYYVKDGVNIATKLTSDGDEKEPYGNVVTGTVINISESDITIAVTGDNMGENIEFDLSECDSVSETISIDSDVAVTYYTNEGINMAIHIDEIVS